MGDSLVFPELPTYLFAPTLAGLLSLLLNFVLPLLAGLLMKASWSTPVKGTILLFLSAVKGFLESWLAADAAHAAFPVGGAVMNSLVVWGIAVATYFGLLRGSSLQRAAITSGVKDRPGRP